MDSESRRRANSATTPISRSSTTNGCPAKATIPLRCAQPLSFTRGSFRTSLVKCAFFSRAINPTFSSPTGIRLYDPSKRVYIPALACNSSMLSSLFSIEMTNDSLRASAQNLHQLDGLGKSSAPISPNTRMPDLRVLRPFSFIDVEHHAIPIGDPIFRVEERLSDGLNPSILAIRPLELVLILVRRSRSGRLQPPLQGRVTVIGMYEFEPPPAG